MIISFSDKETEHFFKYGRTKSGWQSILKVVARKLDALNAAIQLEDLRSPPANRLEALKGDRIGQHSLRINDQWRLCFRWTAAGPKDVEVTDYH